MKQEIYTGADPGFPVGGGASPPGGAPTYDFAKFCEKLHEIEKILGRRRAPLNLPLIHNGYGCLNYVTKNVCASRPIKYNFEMYYVHE